MDNEMLCFHCGMPLGIYNIEIDANGKKTYRHHICNKIIKEIYSPVKVEEKPCPGCNKQARHRTYENGIYVFHCEHCQFSGAGGFGNGGSGGTHPKGKH